MMFEILTHHAHDFVIYCVFGCNTMRQFLEHTECLCYNMMFWAYGVYFNDYTDYDDDNSGPCCHVNWNMTM
jgi:hypothetical protein